MNSSKEPKLPDHLRLHRRPWLMPLLWVVCMVGALSSLVWSGKHIPMFRRGLEQIVEARNELRIAGLALLIATAVFGTFEQFRRWNKTKPALPAFIRVNRALAYGIALAVGRLLLDLGENHELWMRVLFDSSTQMGLGAEALGLSLLVYIIAMHPFGGRPIGGLEPYQVQVDEQRCTYDYTLALRYPEDWEHAAVGPKQWLVWPENGTYGNLLCVGQIGSGKTSQVADPIVQQVLGKFPNDPDRRVSLVVLDLKGNQCARYWEWAKAFGRADDFWVLRPDVIKDRSGTGLVIPKERYVSFNALSGWEETDLLAIEFQEALESTKTRPSPEYFQNVQKEFLIHSLRLLSTEGETPDLGDVQAFVSSAELRGTIIDQEISTSAASARALEDSRRYFREEFGKLSRQDQAGLLRGLASQLTLLTNVAIVDAFCPKRGETQRRELESWRREVLDRPGIIIFSCPPSKYTDGLSRLLGILILKNFQQAMLARCDAGFDGNRQRPVVLMIDEAHAFVNKGLGDFMSVSRECKVSSILLTQSISQFPAEYRGTLLSNTRSRVVLSVSDETARDFADTLGDVVEIKETLSLSESLHGAADHALMERKTGRSKGVAANRSFRQETRRRWSAHAIQHLRRFRAVIHLFDGEQQAESEMVETTAWYRLPYFLLDPLEHPNIKCRTSPTETHNYEDIAGTLVCKMCKQTISESWAITDYKKSRRALKRAEAMRTSR